MDAIDSLAGNESRIKKEVSNKVFIPFVSAAKAKGMIFRDLLDGVPYDESYLLNKRERVEWWVYCKILTNMRPYFSDSDFENLGADFIRGGTYIEGLVGFFLLTSKRFSKMLAGKVLKRISSPILCLNTQIEITDPNKIRFIMKIDENHEMIPEFVYAAKGLIRELGNLSGVKECMVDMKFTPKGAIYDMSWKKESILFNLKRGFRWLFNVDKAFWELTDAHEELVKEYERLEDYKNNLEMKVEERTAELKEARDQLAHTIKLLREAQQVQNRFFANISHEFRTPLTLILGPIRQIIETTKDERLKSELKVVLRNADRLHDLVNQLLDISKLESGEMKLKTTFLDIIPLLKALFQSFISYAERKKIILNFISSEEKITAYIDRDKIEKIFTNILSNAFKFTPEGGQIDLTAAGDEKYVVVTVSDTGIGIPYEKISMIFDRFYQVDGSHTREQEGTGIGLSLTKELVELHKGKIEVESQEGKGTCFKVFIPLGREHLRPEEIEEEVKEKVKVREEVKERGDDVMEEVKTDKKLTEPELITGRKDEGKPVLLIVEDNMDVRNYIKNNLDHEFRIIEAIDGEDGFNRSIENIPDLIISDVMMPKMDGFKLCDMIKKDERTSHIPLILLTAKASSQDKIEGYETGADDYIMKPFETEELKARIKNLIEQRKRIHEHFRHHGLFEIDEGNITPVDQKFMQRVMEIVAKHISGTSFGVEQLAEEMAVSRSLLLKKIEALTGEPPSELIKRTRLNKAAKLIEGRFGTISQISLEVGFNNPSHFAECFKKQFGVSPSHYHQNTNK